MPWLKLHTNYTTLGKCIIREHMEKRKRVGDD